MDPIDGYAESAGYVGERHIDRSIERYSRRADGDTRDHRVAATAQDNESVEDVIVPVYLFRRGLISKLAIPIQKIWLDHGRRN